MITEFFERALENVFDVAGDLATGELPSRDQIRDLLADGLTVAGAADALGITVDMAERILGCEEALSPNT